MALEEPKSFDNKIASYDHIVVPMQMLLMKLGLTQNESKIYLYLNKSGPKKAKEIFQDQKFPRTQIYQILNVLKNKGVVRISSDKIRKFDVTGLDESLEILTNIAQVKIDETKLMQKELRASWQANFYK